MTSCDLSLVSSKLNGLDYNEAVLCSGLSNTVNTMKYGGSSLYILAGRGIYFIDELLDRLQVAYHFLEPEELFGQQKIDMERILVILPSIDFTKIQEINSQVVQFFHTFGTYCVEGIEGDRLILRGDYDEGTVIKSISRADLEKLKGLSVKPLDVSYKIILIDGEHVEKGNIHKCIMENIRALTASEEYLGEEGGWYKGAGFYGKVKRLLVENWNGSFNRVAKFVLVQSIQNGSSFFYRREFGEALKEVYGIADNDFNVAGNLWRKLSRYLKATVVEGKAAEPEVIEDLLEQLQRTEQTLFQRLARDMSDKGMEAEYVIRN